MASKLLDPGFYPGMDMDAYLALPHISNSMLGTFKQAPARLWAARHMPHKVERPETPATILGTAIHLAILEPDSFAASYVRAKPCNAEMKSGKRKGEQCGADGKYSSAEEGWRCGKHKPPTWGTSIVLSPKEWDCCMGLRDNALSKKAQFGNPMARKLLRTRDGEVEVTGVWNDGPTGEAAKLRGDHVTDRHAVNTDIKSCLDASPLEFPRTFYSRRYYAQQAHYSMGFAELQRPMDHHYMIAAEKPYPYLIAVYRVVDDVMDLGRKEVRQLLDLYHECMESDHWPGYPTKLLDIALPYWGEKQLRAAIQLER